MEKHPLHEHPNSKLLSYFLDRDDLVVVHRRALKDHDVFSVPADMEYSFIKKEEWKRIMGESNEKKDRGDKDIK